jgi:pyruvate dehydrogenase E1 component alpha subunit
MATQARQRRSAPQAPPAESAQSAGSAPSPAVESDAVQNASADTGGQLREFYRDMVLVRRFEERAARAYTEARIGG